MIIGRITAKAQTTIPRAVRIALGLKPGDRVAYEIESDHVVLRRVNDTDDPFVHNFARFTEWASEADEEAYRDL